MSQSGLKPVTLTELEVRLASALGDLMEHIEGLEHITQSRDFEPYKAEAVWDDVQSRARAALRRYNDKAMGIDMVDLTRRLAGM